MNSNHDEKNFVENCTELNILQRVHRKMDIFSHVRKERHSKFRFNGGKVREQILLRLILKKDSFVDKQSIEKRQPFICQKDFL